MPFDARAAKLLKPGEHLNIDGCPGLRLQATQSRRSWTYRYRSPVDQRMRQVQIGLWPAMGFHTAAAEWERLRGEREAGVDLALQKRGAREAERAAHAVAVARRRSGAYTVKRLVNDYLAGHVDVSRKKKGAAEVRRMFGTMLAEVAEVPASELTRAQAFDLLESHQGIPVQAAKLRAELGAAWDYALDAGRVPDSTPNWWRQIFRGRLKSKGKRIQGELVGTSKRFLSPAETGELVRWLPNFSRVIDDALTLYLWTLARGVEITAMHKNEISEEGDGWWWTVPKAKTKNARHENATDLRVPIVGRALEIVRRRMGQHEGYLFPAKTEEGHMLQKVVQTSVYYHQPYSETRPEHARPRLTVTHWAPHDLRRTSRTFLAAMDCPEDVGEVMLGHMLPGVKGVYNRHTFDKQRRVWITRLSEYLDTLAARSS